MREPGYLEKRCQWDRFVHGVAGGSISERDIKKRDCVLVYFVVIQVGDEALEK